MVRASLLSAIALLAAAPVTATPSTDPAVLAEHQAIQTAMEETYAEMMRRGPKQPDWQNGGTDIYKALKAAPGGAARNYLLATDKDGTQYVTIVDAGEVRSYLPPQWKLARSDGDATPKGPSILTFGRLGGPHYLVGWGAEDRSGDAFCSKPSFGVMLYEDTASSAEPEIPPEMMPIMFNFVVQQFRKENVCWRYDRDGDGFKVTYFLKDGSTLPEINASGERVTIVPAADIDRILQRSEGKQ